MLAAFDIFVLTSVEEGFGLAVIEAMSAGLPTITTNLPALMEIVVPGDTGVTFGPRDAAALAGHLRSMLSDPEARSAMGRRGRQRVEQHFDVRQMQHKTAAVYRTILAK